MADKISHAMPFISGKNTVLDTIMDVSNVLFYQSHFGGGVEKI